MSENKVLEAAVSLLSKNQGNEKICRFIQYVTKFFVDHKRNKARFIPDKYELLKTSDKLQNLGNIMMITRKVLRFGRHFQLLESIRQIIIQIMEQKLDNLPKAIVTLLSKICLSFFFLFDHIVFFFKIDSNRNINRIKTIKFQYLGNIFWVLECLFSLIRCILQTIDIQQMGVSSVEKRRLRLKVKIQAARNILDLPIACGLMHPGIIPTKVIGILGTITSLIGIYQRIDKQ